MSYCRFQNTLSDLRDCRQALESLADGDESALSSDELEAATSMIHECLNFLDAIIPLDDASVNKAALNQRWVLALQDINNARAQLEG